MRDLGPRIEAVEACFGSDDEEPPLALRFHFSERSFADTAALQQWTARGEARNRANSRPFEPPESLTDIGVVVVRRCEPGEQPSERSLGTHTVAEMRKGAKQTGARP